eukprot:14379163-Alexandrium_andersonii.AAC.1
MLRSTVWTQWTQVFPTAFPVRVTARTRARVGALARVALAAQDKRARLQIPRLSHLRAWAAKSH